MARAEKAGGAAPGRPQGGAKKAVTPTATQAAKAAPAPRGANSTPRSSAAGGPAKSEPKTAAVKGTGAKQAAPKTEAPATPARPSAKAAKATAPATKAPPAKANKPAAAATAVKGAPEQAAGAKGTQVKERAVKNAVVKAAPAKAGGDGNGSAPAGATKDPAAKAPAGTARSAGTAKAAGAAKDAAAKAPSAAAKVPAGTAKAAAATKEPERKDPPRRNAATDKFFLEQRQLLLDERATHLRQAESLKEEADALAAEMEPGESEFGEEGGEGGNLSIERELDLVLSAQAKTAVDEIDRALAKIEAGTYGLCEKCGKEIPRARLKALPHAPLCVACKSGGLSRR